MLTRKEFNEQAIKNDWETFTQRQIYKFSQELLKSEDPKEREWGAIDFVSLTRVEVLNDDLTKSIVYYREQQVEWDKAQDGTLMKARSGVYRDTPVNRKKGIVGMRYGQKKEVSLEKEDRKNRNNFASGIKNPIERLKAQTLKQFNDVFDDEPEDKIIDKKIKVGDREISVRRELDTTGGQKTKVYSAPGLLNTKMWDKKAFADKLTNKIVELEEKGKSK